MLLLRYLLNGKGFMKRADSIFYEIGKFTWLPVLAGGIFFARYGFESFESIFQCDIKRISGFPCPGCGGTRAIYYLFKGDFIRSFLFHPAVLYGVFAYFHFMGLYYYRNYLKKTGVSREIPVQYYVYGALAVVLLQWFVKLGTGFM